MPAQCHNSRLTSSEIVFKLSLTIRNSKGGVSVNESDFFFFFFFPSFHALVRMVFFFLNSTTHLTEKKKIFPGWVLPACLSHLLSTQSRDLLFTYQGKDWHSFTPSVSPNRCERLQQIKEWCPKECD